MAATRCQVCGAVVRPLADALGQNLPSGAISSAVEHLPYKEIVTGSIQYARPFFKSHLLQWVSEVLEETERVQSQRLDKSGVVMIFQDGHEACSAVAPSG